MTTLFSLVNTDPKTSFEITLELGHSSFISAYAFLCGAEIFKHLVSEPLKHLNAASFSHMQITNWWVIFYVLEIQNMHVI